MDDAPGTSIGDKKNPLRLLIMEDMTKKAEANMKAFRDFGYTIVSQQASSTKELQDALHKQSWDLILSPPRLAETNISQILTILARQGAEIPLLVISELENDQTVLDALQSGARDVISLNNPERSQHTIKRELGDILERRQRSYYKQLYEDTEKKCQFLMQQAMQDTPRIAPANESAAHTNPASANAATPVGIPATSPGMTSQPDTVAGKSRADVEADIAISQKKDLLTGFYSRQHFITDVEQRLSSSENDLPPPGLLYIQLDNIHSIRAEAGIAATDLVLGDIAKVLRSNLPEDYPIARIEDYAFSAVIFNKKVEEIKAAAENLRQTIESHVYDILGQAVPPTTFSIGINIAKTPASGIKEFLLRGKVASEIAKSAGGNTIHLYDPDKDRKISLHQDKEWEAKIREAIKNNHFRLAFQPIVNLHAKPAENYEVLVRMIADDNKDILPGEFMSAAEQARLMPSLDRWVVSHAIDAYIGQRENGKLITLFLKLSSQTIADRSFPVWLNEQITDKNISGEHLVFQISEATAIRNPEMTKKLTSWLQIIKCRCALDHFGTHANSVELINEFPVDFLKIDRSLVHNMSTNQKNKDKVKNLIATAQSLEKSTIAVFVQDAATLSLLWQCGVDYIQGYFLQPPDAEMIYEFAQNDN